MDIKEVISFSFNSKEVIRVREMEEMMIAYCRHKEMGITVAIVIVVRVCMEITETKTTKFHMVMS